MKIRAAVPADIPAIMSLATLSQTAAHWTEENYNQIFISNTPQRFVLLAEPEGVLAGFIVAKIVNKEWEIENVVVDAAWRRQGIGSALLKELIQRASAFSAEYILLEVRDSNAAARALYRRAGFVESGRRVRYYQEPVEDAVLYSLKVHTADEV